MLPFQILCVLGALIALACSGCATTHQGAEQSFQGATAVVSCAEDARFRTHHHTSMTCTFENTGDEWRSFEVANLTASKGARLLAPEETAVFAHAWEFKAAKENYNADLALAALALTGLVVAGTSGDRHAGAVGLGVFAGATAASVGREVGSARREVESGPILYSSNHLLGGKFQVPPELFVRKGFLIEFASKDAMPDSLQICFTAPQVECRDFRLAPSEQRSRG